MFDVGASPSLDDAHRGRAMQRLGNRLVEGVLTIAASEQRSQLQNREAALRRLAETLAEALEPPPPPRRPTRVKKSAVEKRLSDKRKRSATKKMRRIDEDPA